MNKKQTLMEKAAGYLMLHAMLVMTALMPLQLAALDVQTLPVDSKAATGFTHAARVTWDDINAADASTVTLALFGIPTNSYIDRVGFYVEEGFTNGTVANTNLTFCLGVGGSTNRFYGTNYIDAGTARLLSGGSPQAYSTNLLVPYFATTSTNYLTVTFSDGAATSVVDNYAVGKVRIYWRLVDLSKYNF
jgi:hypothetical protein